MLNIKDSIDNHSKIEIDNSKNVDFNQIIENLKLTKYAPTSKNNRTLEYKIFTGESLLQLQSQFDCLAKFPIVIFVYQEKQAGEPIIDSFIALSTFQTACASKIIYTEFISDMFKYEQEISQYLQLQQDQVFTGCIGCSAGKIKNERSSQEIKSVFNKIL